jgi:hypothetical protein
MLSSKIMNDAQLLTAIIEYEMNDLEARAYKISLLYLEKAAKLFPNEIHYKVPKGDPRKSYVFKHCHKLLRLHGNDLLESDIKLYVHAQLDILKHITQGQEHPRISPDILSGPKAWNRWLLWKSKYDKVKKFSSTATASQVINKNREKEALELLSKTKMFFTAFFEIPSKDKIFASLDSGEFWLWVRWGKICYYYLLISPIVKQWLQKQNLTLLDKISFNEALYNEGITEDVRTYFEKEFAYEF